MPHPRQLLADLYYESVLKGKVLDIADGGPKGAVAVVKVEGLDTPVIVPVKALELIGAG